MARLKGRPRHIRGWTDGIVEGAEPDLAQPQGTFPRGTMDAAINLIATPAGRLAIRRGSKVRRTLHISTGQDMQRVLGVWPYTQLGAVAIAHYLNAGAVEIDVYRLTADLAFTTGTEATSRHALSWPANTTDVPRPVVVELFENVYVVDAHTDFSLRNALQKMTSTGTVTSPTHNLDGISSGGIKAYCAAAYNSVLFVAGYDSVSGGEEKAMLRHSFLGVDPGASNGFDKDAYAIIGAEGQRITAMAPGRQILLVAKANELYRVTGTGRGLPGWQYTIQQVENTQGVGVSNPYALCFAEGFWWGIGEAGPFRTNGTTAEPLVAARMESWRRVANLRTAWVCYWPDRRVIKFGFNTSPADTGRSSTYPFVVWNWDIDNECWTGDDKFSADLHFVQAIPSLTAAASGAGVGPAGVPSALASSIASSTTSSAVVTWTNGDASAQTEVWLRNESGASSLYALVAAGNTSRTISGLDAGRVYSVKVRHVKDGITTVFTSEVEARTLLPMPSLSLVDAHDLGGGVYYVSFSVGAIAYLHPSTQLRRVTSWGGHDDTTTVSQSGSTHVYTDGAPPMVATVTWVNTTWPVSYQASTASQLAVGPSAAPSALASDIASSTTSQAALTWTNGDATASTEIWLRTETGTSALYSTEAAGVASKTITGLEAGRKYLVKIRHVKDTITTAFTAGEVTAYTRLPTPSLSLISSTPDGGGTYTISFSVGAVSYLHSLTQLHITSNWGVNDTVTPNTSGSTHNYSSVPAGGFVQVTFQNSSWPGGYTSGTTSNLTVA